MEIRFKTDRNGKRIAQYFDFQCARRWISVSVEKADLMLNFKPLSKTGQRIMYEFIYSTATGSTGSVRFFAASQEEATEKAREWNPDAIFTFVGLWAVN